MPACDLAEGKADIRRGVRRLHELLHHAQAVLTAVCPAKADLGGRFACLSALVHELLRLREMRVAFDEALRGEDAFERGGVRRERLHVANRGPLDELLPSGR